MRASSSATETPGLLEDTQFGDVAPEEERHRPVGHDTQLPGKQRQLVEVIGPRHPPAEEALEREAEHRRDALVATKSRDLAQTPVAIGLWFAGEVLRQASCLAQCMLARGRVDPARGGGVRHRRAVAERPDVVGAVDVQQLADSNSPSLVERQAELGEERMRFHSGRPDDGAREQMCAVRQADGMRFDLLEGRVHANVDSAAGEKRGSVVAQPTRDLGEDLGRRVDEQPVLRRRLERPVVASASTPAYPAPTKTKVNSRRRWASAEAAAATSSRVSTWFRRWIASASDLKPRACSARPGIGSVRATAPRATTRST